MHLFRGTLWKQQFCETIWKQPFCGTMWINHFVERFGNNHFAEQFGNNHLVDRFGNNIFFGYCRNIVSISVFVELNSNVVLGVAGCDATSADSRPKRYDTLGKCGKAFAVTKQSYTGLANLLATKYAATTPMLTGNNIWYCPVTSITIAAVDIARVAPAANAAAPTTANSPGSKLLSNIPK